MKITTHQQLSTIADTVFDTYQQIGIEIEDEKEFEIWVSYAELNRWVINMRWIEALRINQRGYEVPVYGRQGIYVSIGASSYKVIKDLLCELESIAEKPCPELIEIDTFDELLADEKRYNS